MGIIFALLYHFNIVVPFMSRSRK